MRKRRRLSQRQQRIVAIVEALGWASGSQLAFLDGADPGQRNYYTEKYLPQLVRRGKLWTRDWGRERVYRLTSYGTGRNPNIEHALAARLVRAAGISPELIVPRRTFVENGGGQIPDAAVILPATNGRHLFLVEYQSARESERTTGDKVDGYKTCSERLRQDFGVTSVWVLFILDVPRQSAEVIARRYGDGWTLFIFCDHETFLTQDWRTIWQAPIFLDGHGHGACSLVAAEAGDMSLLRIDPLFGLRLPDAGRTLGTRVLGGPGSGKSVLLAIMAFLDFLRGIPTVLWDINGGLIDAFWAMVLDRGGHDVEMMQHRIRYVDVGNTSYAYGCPFYYKLPGDDAFAVSQRPLEIFLKVDPALKQASILGESSMREIGTATGMIMAVMDDGKSGPWQITEAVDALLHYKDRRWADVFKAVEPSVPEAVRFFRESYGQWKTEEQHQRRWSFESRCWPYVSSQTLRAIVGQTRPGIDFDGVMRQGLCVMFDFRHIRDRAVRDGLSLLWTQRLFDFIERRGVSVVQPLSLIFDEVPALLENPALEPELRRMIDRYRAMKVWPVIAHQSLSQLSPSLRESSWSFGNQIIGKQLEFEACLEIVRNLIAVDPYRVKWPDIQEAMMQDPDQPLREPQTMPLAEQERELAAWIQHRAGRQFLVRRFYDEETPDPAVRFIARTPDVHALRNVPRQAIERAKEENLQRFAHSVDEVLREIDARLPGQTPPQQERPKL